MQTNESIEKINTAMINYARQIAQEIKATAVLVYVDVLRSRKNMENLLKERRCILAHKTVILVDYDII